MQGNSGEERMAAKPKLAIFRGADSVPLEATDAMEVVMHPGAADGVARMYESGVAEGSDVRVLYRSADPGGFSLTSAWFKSHYPLPAHTHNSDCLYYVVAGSLLMGTNELRAGDGFFLPAGTPYKYTAGAEGVDILEFRGVSAFDIQIQGSTPRIWEKLAAMCASHRDAWRTEEHPVRNVAATASAR